MGSIITGIIEEGLVYAILSFGIYITYSILDFPDLSVDGTYPLGAAVTAAMIAAGADPLLTLPVAFLAGALAGVLTGTIHVKLGVRDLLSGIIVSTGLYSINLRIAGKSNLPIFSKDSIFSNGLVDSISFWTPISTPGRAISSGLRAAIRSWSYPLPKMTARSRS